MRSNGPHLSLIDEHNCIGDGESRSLFLPGGQTNTIGKHIVIISETYREKVRVGCFQLDKS